MFGFFAEEQGLLTDWLENVSPEEFHGILEQCAVLPEGFKNYPVLSSEFAQALEKAFFF